MPDAMHTPKSLFDGSGTADSTERIETLAAMKNVTIERIVSSGTQPPASYLQDHDEWVLLVRGEAEMTIDGERVLLEAGEHAAPAGRGAS